MTTDDLRKLYLDFFKSKDHRAFPSDSLIPADDPSLLFTGAGMNQFKPYFLGLKKDLKRATSSQKCLRTADVDRVGKTAYHHTFFEMLGNFSFGDYFKEEAIAWGWEFVTRVLKIPTSRLWVSVYEKDDEAFVIWRDKIGLPESRIVRMGPVDNFWPSNAPEDGPNGPCGPCSEIYVGETPGKGVEIWNLVFTQFDRQSDGSLIPLPQKNIDTGMGLERTAAIMQGVDSNFDTDNFQKIRAELKKLLTQTKRAADEKQAIAHENAVMDHVRAVIFSISDGATPSNEGRGYVIRKLIRLASEHLQKAGAAEEGTLHRLVPVVIDVMKPAYPELVSRQKDLITVIQNEEKSYFEVIHTHAPRLAEEWKRVKSDKEAGEVAFKYYDTHGLSYDFIEASATESGRGIDKNVFNALLEEQQRRSRQSSKISGEIFAKTDAYDWVHGLPSTEFLGYETTQGSGKLLRVIFNQKITDTLGAEAEGLLIFDRTPFYAESGGQIGDTGVISGDGFRAKVMDTQWLEKCVAHKVFVEQGEARAGKTYELKVEADRRSDIMKNHTATHLLHAALRKVLGTHVKQSGSLVAKDYLRFDFTHFSGVAPAALAEVEALVNGEVEKNITLDKKVLPKEEAMRQGAMAFFGEKYGDEVRVVKIGDFSQELCGGTHLKSTGEIGRFKIVSESSIQAGVRRIEAVTGRWADELLHKQEGDLDATAKDLGADKNRLPEEIKKLQTKLSGTKNRLTQLLNGKIQSRLAENLKNAPLIAGARYIEARIPGADAENLKSACDYLKSLNTPFAAFLVSDSAEKVSFAVSGSEGLVQKGFHAGKIVKEAAAVLQGNGGGRPDFAVGGGKDVQKIKDAVALGGRLIKEVLSK